MKLFWKRSLILSFSTFSSLQANGLDQMFEALGAQVQQNSAGSYQDQAAGYYTGGGFALRQKNTTLQPITISLPKVGVGCNKLDMYFGAISFLKGEQLTQLAREVISGAPIYAFQLGMKTMAPQIENLMSSLMKKIQDLNATMLNSCNLSQQLVGGLWPKGTAAREMICQDSRRGDAEDWFGARKHCAEDKHKITQADRVKQTSPDLLIGEYNLVWHVIQKMSEYKDQKDLAHFIMTTVGTLISRKEGTQMRLHSIAGKADQKEYVAAYLKGGTVTQLNCIEQKQCLTPKLVSLTLQGEQTMKAKVRQHIESLRQKYLSKDAFGAEDFAFLDDAVGVPIYKYIQISAIVGTPFLLDDATEYVALTLLLSQFDKISARILEALEDLHKIQLEDSSIEAFKKNLQETRTRLQSSLNSLHMNAAWQLTKMMKAYEQTIIARNS